MNDERTHKRKRADNAQAGAYVHTPQATKRKGGRNAPDIRSIYVGVTWDKPQGKWKSRIMLNGKMSHLGYYELEQQAAKAYDVEAAQIPGKGLNFPSLPGHVQAKKSKTSEGENKPTTERSNILTIVTGSGGAKVKKEVPKEEKLEKVEENKDGDDDDDDGKEKPLDSDTSDIGDTESEVSSSTENEEADDEEFGDLLFHLFSSKTKSASGTMPTEKDPFAVYDSEAEDEASSTDDDNMSEIPDDEGNDVPEDSDDEDHRDAVKVLYEGVWWLGRAEKRVPSGVKVRFVHDDSFIFVANEDEDSDLQFLRDSDMRKPDGTMKRKKKPTRKMAQSSLSSSTSSFSFSSSSSSSSHAFSSSLGSSMEDRQYFTNVFGRGFWTI